MNALPQDKKKEDHVEKAFGVIAAASLQLNSEGEYIEHSLSISPILWAMGQIRDNKDKLPKFDLRKYKEAVETLESKYFPKPEKTQIDEDENVELNDTEDIIKYTDGQEFSPLAVKKTKLNALMEDVLKQYIPKNFNERSIGPNNQEILNIKRKGHINTRVFVNPVSNGDDEEDSSHADYMGLSSDFFSQDLQFVMDELSEENASEKDLESIVEYILALQPIEGKKRRNVLYNDKEQTWDEYVKMIYDIMDPMNAPIGKWPSRYMPAFMQQMAVNLATINTRNEADVNNKIFSVNGPPGTGKTTLLKEIVVNNIVERAILLSEYSRPDDAFNNNKFENGPYHTYIHRWHSFKNDKIADYSMLVTSCNNTAVENISKELPKSFQKEFDLTEEDTNKASDERVNSYKEIGGLFDVEKKGKLEKVNRYGKELSYKDIYFTDHADKLLKKSNDSDPDAWGLIAAALGNRANISNFYKKALNNILIDFNLNDDRINARLGQYEQARKIFLDQLNVVRSMQQELSNYNRLLKYEYDKRKEHESNRVITDKKISGLDEEIARYKNKRSSCLEQKEILAEEAQKLHQEHNVITENQNKLSSDMSDNNASKRSNYEEIDRLYASIRFWWKWFAKDRLKSTEGFIEHLKKEQEKINNRIEEISNLIQNAKQNEEDVKKQELSNLAQQQKIEDEIFEISAQLKKLEQEKEFVYEECKKIEDEYRKVSKEWELKREYLNNAEPRDMKEMQIMGEEYIRDLLSLEVDKSTKAHVKNPWFNDSYNREREKLFAYAMLLHKEFVICSKCCRQNIKTLLQTWGLGAESDQKPFSIADKDAMMPSLWQSLFLLVPVISTTFASVGRMMADVKKRGVVGLLIVDEAGQAQPQHAIGALYRSRRAIIVGDPKQIEPVVTDDLAYLKNAYDQGITALYTDKKNSVQKFADMVNPYGTDLGDSGAEQWVGSPLLVHRRCISPMFDISNALSYGGIMKQQTLSPKNEERFILNRSQWFNVIGKEKGGGDHFVPEQGKKVCELIEEAFKKHIGTEKIPSIYIITPFTTVKNGMSEYIKKYFKNNKEILEYFDDNNKKIGTVHTFQGKEADEVIFVLGCDQNSLGAVRWVNDNIVNVAVTRAKYRLYVIGDERVWRESHCVSLAKSYLDTYVIKEIVALGGGEIEDNEKREKQIELARKLPSLEAFSVEKVEFEGVEDHSIYVDGFEKALQGILKQRDFTEEECKILGVKSIEELNGFSDDVRKSLEDALRLYLYLKPILSVAEDINASCCAVMFCKALEQQMRDSFGKGIRNNFPEHSKVKDKDMTLGYFLWVLEKKNTELTRKIKGYDSMRWSAFRTRLDVCTKERNKCCHTGKYTLAGLNKLMKNMFKEDTIGTKNIRMRGLMFESEIGKKL